MLKIYTPKINFCSSSSSQISNEDAPYNGQNTKPAFDKFIKDCETIDKLTNQKNPSLVKKLLTYPTLNVIPFLSFLIGESFVLGKGYSIKKQVKAQKMSKEALKEYLDKLPKKLWMLGIVPLTVGFIMSLVNEKGKDKHKKAAYKIVDNFNKENNTNIGFKVQSLGLIIGASMDPISGGITMDDKFVEDSLYANTHQKPFLKHELVHAKQYMLMACSENGIEKLNYLAVKKLANTLDVNGKKEILDIYNEIQSGISDKYKKATINRGGYNINSVDYITALYKIIYEPEIQPKDIPIIINKDFYGQIRAKKGKLTPSEEKKAQEYLNAYEKYPTKIGFLQAFNPNSEYRRNLLEKEAYKMNPWYTY